MKEDIKPPLPSRSRKVTTPVKDHTQADSLSVVNCEVKLFESENFPSVAPVPIPTARIFLHSL